MANAYPTRVRLLIIAGCLSYLITGQEVTTDECTSNFGGISINGRCFFVIIEHSSLSEAWARCSDDGATLAQIHATNEYDGIKAMLDSKARNPSEPGFIRAWIALQRDGSTTDACVVTSNTTFWYDGPNTKNTNMPAGDTWVRSHPCDDEDPGDDKFFALMMLDGDWMGILDLPDALPGYYLIYPLCQMSLNNHSYAKSTEDECIAERPIESMPVDCIDVCALECSRRSWCRSFDVITSTLTCNLFTWVSSDAAEPKMKTGGCDCVHYDINQ